MVETNARSSGFPCLDPGISETYQQSRHFIPCEVDRMRKKSLYQLVMFAHECPVDYQDIRDPKKRQSEERGRGSGLGLEFSDPLPLFCLRSNNGFLYMWLLHSAGSDAIRRLHESPYFFSPYLQSLETAFPVTDDQHIAGFGGSLRYPFSSVDAAQTAL